MGPKNVSYILVLSPPESSLKEVVILYPDMSGGQNYLLLAMDMAKVGGPISVGNVCTSMLCAKIGYRQVGGPLSVVNVFAQN